jgi:hypothetical protein
MEWYDGLAGLLSGGSGKEGGSVVAPIDYSKGFDMKYGQGSWLNPATTIADKNLYITGLTKPGDTFMGMSGDTMKSASGLANALGTAYDLGDKLWGTSGKVAKEQLGMLQQQRADNQYKMDERKQFRNDTKQSFA